MDRLEEVLRLFLVDLHVEVARHAEPVDAAQAHSREDRADVPRNDLFDEDERVPRRLAVRRADARHLHEARDHHRHLHDTERRLAAAVAIEHDAEVQGLVAEVRERVTRVDGDRREDREDLALEPGVERPQLGLVELLRFHEQNPVVGELRNDVLEALRLRLDELMHALGDGAQRLGRGHPVGPELADLAGELLLEPGDAHHEELVEVRSDDGEELEALEQRNRLVFGLGEDAPVELEPRELPVQVEVRRAEVGLHNASAVLAVLGRRHDAVRVRRQLTLGRGRLRGFHGGPRDGGEGAV